MEEGDGATRTGLKWKKVERIELPIAVIYKRYRKIIIKDASLGDANLKKEKKERKYYKNI